MSLLVFDSLSELLVPLGDEKSQHFLRRATELLSLENRRSLFIIKKEFHDARSRSVVGSTISHKLTFDDSGLNRLDPRPNM